MCFDGLAMVFPKAFRHFQDFVNLKVYPSKVAERLSSTRCLAQGLLLPGVLRRVAWHMALRGQILPRYLKAS